MAKRTTRNLSDDGIDRRGFLECMAWAGSGLLWTMNGGIAHSQIAHTVGKASPSGTLNFVQISDSHMGFNKPANPDVAATLQEAVAKINALPAPPLFVIHTGDISHLSKPSEFDTVDQILKSIKTSQIFYVPGEHDGLGDNGKLYLERYGKGTNGLGWYSFDQKGVHFVGLVNVFDLKPGGLGLLGDEQLRWLEKDLASQSGSTPIVLFAHIPLWSVYPDWGWGTDDSAQALSYLKRFGSVTVLNGHIHQILQKVEGNAYFHTAASTAFPQPAPGVGPAPGPLTVPADRLRNLLGITEVKYVPGNHALAVTDTSLASASTTDQELNDPEVKISNFTFDPASLEIPPRTKVTWTNHDDQPHTVTSTKKAFASPALDTDDHFSFTFDTAGEYPYYCKIHPRMTGKVVVK
jgi:3',5'-cyclic-AMP phosphodiesterase